MLYQVAGGRVARLSGVTYKGTVDLSGIVTMR